MIGICQTNSKRINACDVPEKYEELKQEFDTQVCRARARLRATPFIGSLYVYRKVSQYFRMDTWFQELAISFYTV